MMDSGNNDITKAEVMDRMKVFDLLQAHSIKVHMDLNESLRRFQSRKKLFLSKYPDPNDPLTSSKEWVSDQKILEVRTQLLHRSRAVLRSVINSSLEEEHRQRILLLIRAATDTRDQINYEISVIDTELLVRSLNKEDLSYKEQVQLLREPVRLTSAIIEEVKSKVQWPKWSPGSKETTDGTSARPDPASENSKVSQ